MPPAAEVLVHIFAPCKASDDTRYRKEAQEYLLFKSANRRSLCCSSSSLGDGKVPTPSVEREAAPSMLGEGETVYSNVDLSSLETPSRISKIYVTRTPLETRPQTAPASISCIKETPAPFLHRRSQSASCKQPSSFIPDSQPPHALAISLSKRRYHSRSPSPFSSSESPSSKRRRVAPRTSVAPVVDSIPSSTLSEWRLDLENGISYQPKFSVLAPPPRPSNETFKTYVTAPLALITAHLPLPTFYVSFHAQPPSRRLQTHERGHWALSVSSFSKEHKTKVWTYLAKFIGAGRAGRVSCFLEEKRKVEAEIRNDEPATWQPDGTSRLCKDVSLCEPESGPHKEDFLRVYCMGEVVPSIWLLLFIATTRQIKGCRAQWIDASGMVVIQMQ